MKLCVNRAPLRPKAGRWSLEMSCDEARAMVRQIALFSTIQGIIVLDLPTLETEGRCEGASGNLHGDVSSEGLDVPSIRPLSDGRGG